MRIVALGGLSNTDEINVAKFYFPSPIEVISEFIHALILSVGNIEAYGLTASESYEQLSITVTVK